MARSETAARGLVIYVTSNLFTTSSTPGTARTATSISRRRSAPRASLTSSASFAGVPSWNSPPATLLFRTEPGHEGEAAVAYPALVEGLLKLGLTGEFDLASSASSSLYQGGQVLLLGGREAGLVALLALEEPHAPGEGDKDAARLGARDLAVAPVHPERRPFVHVPERPLEADRILAARPGSVLHPFIRESLDPLVDTALARGILPEAGDPEPPLPVEVPVNDTSRVEVVHGDGEMLRVRGCDLPSPPQVRRAFERPVLPALRELGYLPRRPWIFVNLQTARVRVVRVAQRVAAGGSADPYLAEGAAPGDRLDPG